MRVERSVSRVWSARDDWPYQKQGVALGSLLAVSVCVGLLVALVTSIWRCLCVCFFLLLLLLRLVCLLFLLFLLL